LNAWPSTPWCMSFVQYMSRKYLGYNGPKTASARDGLKMGNKIDIPEVGSIVVTRWSGPSGCHIGISVGNGEYISWNSGNAVKTKKIPSGSQFRSLKPSLWGH
jgi:cell wall-associated NlpC family hydrolase